MIEDIKTIEQTVYGILADKADTRDNDTLLLIEVWRSQGITIDKFLETQILEFGAKPESVRRSRQIIQERGEFQGLKRKARLQEEIEMRDLFGNAV